MIGLSHSRHRFEWQTIGATVAGAAHLKQDRENQDSLWLPATSDSDPLIVSVSDGHGGKHSFRSASGSRYAVTAVSEAWAQLTDRLKDTDVATARRLIEAELPRIILGSWRDKVDRDVADRPFEFQEQQLLLQDVGSIVNRVPYGATLLSIAVFPGYLVYVQLGDGDILSVSDERVVSRPLSKDSRMLGDETTSLCLDEAEIEFRIKLESITRSPPALLLISTDGYYNSFQDDRAFMQVGVDFLENIRALGAEETQAYLAQWLSETSEEGSGDDISIAIICRVAADPDSLKGNWLTRHPKRLWNLARTSMTDKRDVPEC